MAEKSPFSEPWEDSDLILVVEDEIASFWSRSEKSFRATDKDGILF